ncbi:hypothetical protein ACKI1I_13815 [Streptomyces turgidiscabies]|nr:MULTISPECIES: hypothetical protein [Streptomyces]MDX3492955.1 hypothetical protein [Streptomyces turgidiscabies]
MYERKCQDSLQTPAPLPAPSALSALTGREHGGTDIERATTAA